MSGDKTPANDVEYINPFDFRRNEPLYSTSAIDSNQIREFPILPLLPSYRQ